MAAPGSDYAYMLSVHVRAAKELKNVDIMGTSDPYAIVTFGEDVSLPAEGRTAVVDNNLSPEWGSTFTFLLTPAVNELRLDIKASKVGKDTAMGHVTLSVRELTPLAQSEEWYDVVDGEGQVQLGLFFAPLSDVLSLKPELDATKAELEASKATVAELQGQLADKDSELEAKDGELTASAASLEEVKVELGSVQEQLAGASSAAEEEKAALAATVEELTTAMAEKEEELSDAQNALVTALADLELARGELSEEEHARREAEQAAKEAAEAAKEEEEESDELEEQVAKLKKQVKTLKGEKKKLKAKVKALEKQTIGAHVHRAEAAAVSMAKGLGGMFRR